MNNKIIDEGWEHKHFIVCLPMEFVDFILSICLAIFIPVIVDVSRLLHLPGVR